MTESIVREATISSPNISIRRLYILNQQGVGLGEELEDCYSSGSQLVENRGLSFSWSGTLKATVLFGAQTISQPFVPFFFAGVPSCRMTC